MAKHLLSLLAASTNNQHNCVFLFALYRRENLSFLFSFPFAETALFDVCVCVCVYTNRGGIMMERRKFDRRVAAKVSRWWKTRPSAPFFVQRREYNQTSRSCIRYIGECWLGVIFVQQWKSVATLVVERGWWWRLGFKYRAAHYSTSIFRFRKIRGFRLNLGETIDDVLLFLKDSLQGERERERERIW